jgi:hypothetical protein
MKKIIIFVLLLTFIFTLGSTAFAKSIGTYDYYTGIVDTWKIYKTARPKCTSNIAGVDNNKMCYLTDLGPDSYLSAIFKKVNNDPNEFNSSERWTYWHTINSGQRILIGYFNPAPATSTGTYRLAHDFEAFQTIEGSWSPDHN